jgi:hypothetical protein
LENRFYKHGKFFEGMETKETSMKSRKGKKLRIAAVTSIAALGAIGCASKYAGANQPETGRHAESRIQDTSMYYGQDRNVGGSRGPDSGLYQDTGAYRYPATGGSTGTGVGGGVMPDSGYNDSLGIYGPTGPMPGDKGRGGGAPPRDTLWGDSLAPPDTDAMPDGRAGQVPEGGYRSNW